MFLGCIGVGYYIILFGVLPLNYSIIHSQLFHFTFWRLSNTSRLSHEFSFVFAVSASSSAHSSPSATRGKRRQRKACSSTPSSRMKKIKLGDSAASADDDDIVMVAEGLWSISKFTVGRIERSHRVLSWKSLAHSSVNDSDWVTQVHITWWECWAERIRVFSSIFRDHRTRSRIWPKLAFRPIDIKL